MKASCAGAAFLSAAATALGQASFTNDSMITTSMSWSDNGLGNGNNNGTLDPGEAALITMTASFTNEFGTAHFSPPVGNLSSGTIVGLGALWIDLQGSPLTAGTFNNSMPLANTAGTSGYGVRGNWRIAGPASNGTINGIGIDNIQIGQGHSQEPPLTDNPVTNVYRLLWTPNSYDPRDAAFAIVPDPAAGTQAGFVAVDLGNGTGLFVAVPLGHIEFGTVHIQVVPTPAGVGVLSLGFVFCARRSRRDRRRH